MKRRGNQNGSVVIEMTLIGIPMIFVLISAFEISRGMWMYHTLAHAVKAGVRFAMVRGSNCQNSPPQINNNCQVAVSDVANVIRYNGVGLDIGSTQVKFISRNAANTITCNLGTTCAANNSIWPPAGQNYVGDPLRIDIQTPFQTPLAMFWPGANVVSFTMVQLPASSQDRVTF